MAPEKEAPDGPEPLGLRIPPFYHRIVLFHWPKFFGGRHFRVLYFPAVAFPFADPKGEIPGPIPRLSDLLIHRDVPSAVHPVRSYFEDPVSAYPWP